MEFLKLGVKCVLAVKSEHKIDDEFATEFSIEFYSRLLEKKSIISAFNKAKASVLEKLSKKNRVSEICCCAHDHKPWCEWFNQAVKNLGIDQVTACLIIGSLAAHTSMRLFTV